MTLKAVVFFIEDGEINEYTDFKAVNGLFDLNDLEKHFKSITLDFAQPFKTRCMLEGLNLLNESDTSELTFAVQSRFLWLNDYRRKKYDNKICGC